MKIAICDDERLELDCLYSYLKTYYQMKSISVQIVTFTSALELLNTIKNDSFDLLFLDIIMPERNGMQVAHEIREFDKNINIIFLTSSPEFAVESYEVKAYTYLLKPVVKEKLYFALDELMGKIQCVDDYLLVKHKTGIACISFSNLCYIEVMGRTLSFHLVDGTTYETNATLNEYEERILSHPEFLRVHRAFLVNLWQMKELLAQDFITVTGDTIPVSRRLYPNVRISYIESLFTKS